MVSVEETQQVLVQTTTAKAQVVVELAVKHQTT
jgi:hypothetical protein